MSMNDAETNPNPRAPRRFIALLALVVLAIAGGTYAWLGNPAAVNPAPQAAASAAPSTNHSRVARSTPISVSARRRTRKPSSNS